MTTEKELKKCIVCEGILKYCAKRGKKKFCKNLLVKLEKREITEKEFGRRLGKKFDLDDMVEQLIKNA